MNQQQNSSRNHIPKGYVARLITKCVLFAIVCIWLFYQMKHSLYARANSNCNDIESKFNGKHVRTMLGRKVNVGSSNNANDHLNLYGMDLIEAAEKIKHVTHELNESVEGNADEEPSDNEIPMKIASVEERFDHLKQGDELTRVIEEDKASTAESDGDEKLILEKWEVEDDKVRKTDAIKIQSDVSKASVILKKDETSRVFQFSDENGTPADESTPSRRSDIQFDRLSDWNISSPGNRSREMEACEQVCLQEMAKKQRLNKFPKEAVYDEEVSEMIMVKSGEGSMREILSTERWLNTTEFLVSNSL